MIWRTVPPGRRGRSVTDDTGLATVFTCICVAVLIILTGLGVRLGAAVIARHRAESAADLAALAGARWAPRGAGSACERAATIAASNHVRMVGCRLEDLDVLVETESRVGTGVLTVTAGGRARAGPDRVRG